MWRVHCAVHIAPVHSRRCHINVSLVASLFKAIDVLYTDPDILLIKPERRETAFGPVKKMIYRVDNQENKISGCWC